MKSLIQKLIHQIITRQALINHYPEPGVIFLELARLFNDPTTRKLISQAVTSTIDPQSFDTVASIASRGYLFSGMITSQFSDKGELLVQKVKSRGDTRYLQRDMVTEYSSDALQVFKDTIIPGKKYLLTDDLIATGGSVTTAIQLIQDGGGEIDTVFVMTELTDFNARERLEQQGIKLVSLLRFTQQDLNKLLDIQNYYAENTSAPITYQLTHYTQGDEALTESNSAPEQVDPLVSIRRSIVLKHPQQGRKYAKKGIFFKVPEKMIDREAFNFYNHGCPIEQWAVDPATVAPHSFQIFATGDAFAVISPDVAISGANIHIHVGVEHDTYSPLTLLQEALQLCRCAYEHGARSITIALPDQFHPVAHFSDFNSLLVSLLKASGANKVHYYGRNYTGTLDETGPNATIPLVLSTQEDDAHYQIDKRALRAYLQPPAGYAQSNLDEKIMYFSRERHARRTWSKFTLEQSDLMESIDGHASPSAIIVPEISVQPHVLLCCSANKPLAEKIAADLCMRGETVMFYSIEGTGEQARIPEDATICGSIVTIVQSTRPSPDDIEATREYQKNGASAYFFAAAMIARQARLRGAKTINLINPYQFSARSDKAEANVKGNTGAYVQQNGRLLEAAGVNRVITAECHDAHTLSGAYTGKTIRGLALPALSLISTRLAEDWIKAGPSMQGQLRLVSPDAGAAKRTKELTEQLQAILGEKFCQSRVLGEKQRDSHQDASAQINCLNSGSIDINPHDKYLITDDETATGSTLCQAVMNLVNHGANDISVIIVHNNMPLDWLSRQLCLARFFYLGVNDLHFSDTHEMGTLAKSYDDLIAYAVQYLELSEDEVKAQVFTWFQTNISERFSDQSEDHITREFTRFTSMFEQFESSVTVHSLAHEFADKVTTQTDMSVSHVMEGSSGTAGIHAANSKLPLFTQQPRPDHPFASSSIALRQ